MGTVMVNILEDGKPIQVAYDDPRCQGDNRHVADTMIAHRRISTVLLKFDESMFGGSSQPFETMVFNYTLRKKWWQLWKQKSDPWHRYCKRYSLYEEAKVGHSNIMCLVSDYPKGPP